MRTHFDQLLDWKMKKLDPKIDKAIKAKYEAIKRLTEQSKQLKLVKDSSHESLIKSEDNPFALVKYKTRIMADGTKKTITIKANYNVKRCTHNQILFNQYFTKGDIRFEFDVKKDMDHSESEFRFLNEIEKYQKLQWFVEVVKLSEG